MQAMSSLHANSIPGRAVLLPPRPARRHQLTAVCTAKGPQECTSAGSDINGQEQKQRWAVLALKAAVVASAANAMVACMPPAAAAAGWQPRRHTQSRLRERFATEETPKQAAERRAAHKQQQAAARAAAQAAQPSGAGSDIGQLVQGLQQRLQRMWRGKEAYSVGISANRQQVYGSGRPPSASPLGWVALAAAAAALVALLSGGRLRLPWGGGRGRGQGGRWVRDRSLGGRMVFIPDADAAPGGKPQKSLYDELGGSDDDVTPLPAAGSGNGGGEGGLWGPARQAQQAAPSQPDFPAWWRTPSFLVYAPFSRKEELQRQARLVLRQLEDAKLLQGLDYSLSALVTLRTLCQEAGGYQVKPRTDSGRDAMLRAAVRAAISAAQEGQYALIGGNQPAKFVCGLAHDLGVPDSRAVTIVHAEVAAVCRAALIDAEAAYRASNQPDIVLALIKIAGTLQAFPLPAGSAEAELVAAGITKQTSLEFRKAIFLEFGAVSLPLAALVAELLGFDPALVIPYLEKQLAAEAQAASATQAEEQRQQEGQ